MTRVFHSRRQVLLRQRARQETWAREAAEADPQGPPAPSAADSHGAVPTDDPQQGPPPRG